MSGATTRVPHVTPACQRAAIMSTPRMQTPTVAHPSDDVPIGTSPCAMSATVHDHGEPEASAKYPAEDLIIFSRLHPKPTCDFTKAFEYSFFGAYTIESEAYKISRIRAA